jgi:hypothetical protein
LNTVLNAVEFLLVAAVLAQIVGAVFRKEKGKQFLAMKPVQRRCVVLALMFAAVAVFCLRQGGDVAIIGTTVCGLLAFGMVFGAALYDG